MNIRVLTITAASTLGLASAQACGPDFHVMLATCGSTCLQHIRNSGLRSELAPLLTDIPGKLREDAHEGEPTSAVEANDILAAQRPLLDRMRHAHDADEAYRVGAGLPEDVRHYTAGAVAFRQAHLLVPWGEGYGDANEDSNAAQPNEALLNAAIAQFQNVVDLPSAQSTKRLLWAEFMLGRSYQLRSQSEDPARAIKHFERAVAIARAGAADPLGLGGAAQGELGRLALDQGKLEQAVSLYALQASAPGATHALTSLITAVHLLSKQSDRLRADLGDPLLQKLLVTYAVERISSTCDRSECDDAIEVPEDFDRRLLDALHAIPTKQMAVPDRIAVLAYGMSDYAFADKVVVLSSTPVAHWVHAKLALHRGASAEAEAEFAEAARHFPPAAPQKAGDDQDDPAARLYAEWAILKLSRSDYLGALDQLQRKAPDFDEDIAYIAERVLTLPELKAYVDSHADCGALIHNVLAARLARDNRFIEAQPYYSSADVRASAAAYSRAESQAKHGKSPADRAEGWYDMAELEINLGMELTGAFLAPDGALNDGNFIGEPVAPSDLASVDEQTRVAASVIVPDRAYHYRAIAVTHFIAAAKALPHRSAEASIVLCQGANALRHHHEDAGGKLVMSLYRQYQRIGKPAAWDRNFGSNCPALNFHPGI